MRLRTRWRCPAGVMGAVAWVGNPRGSRVQISQAGRPPLQRRGVPGLYLHLYDAVANPNTRGVAGSRFRHQNCNPPCIALFRLANDRNPGLTLRAWEFHSRGSRVKAVQAGLRDFHHLWRDGVGNARLARQRLRARAIAGYPRVADVMAHRMVVVAGGGRPTTTHKTPKFRTTEVWVPHGRI